MNAFNNIAGDLERKGIVCSMIDIASVRSRMAADGERVYHSFLAPAELSYVKNMKIAKRRADFICGRIAGKRAVKRLIDNDRNGMPVTRERRSESVDIEIRRTRTGAPRVFFNNEPARVRVSISHSPCYAASAACNGEEYRGIGIDLEKIEPRDTSLLAVAFSTNEISAMRERALKSGGMDMQITRYWSMKEAVLKSMGAGLNIDLKDIEIVEKKDGNKHVILSNEAKNRFDELSSHHVEVKDYVLSDHILSIACLI